MGIMRHRPAGFVVAAIAFAACSLAASPSAAAPTASPASVNAGGGWQTGAVVRCLSAIGQPIAFGFSSSSHRLSRAGMLFVPLLDPGRDADGNGIPDEDSPDDDSDSLSDLIEILGASFSPATATDPLRRDSDGDGAGDADEAAAGTDPLDPQALLRILAIGGTAAGLRLDWVARGGRSYDVIVATSVSGLASAGIAQVVTAGTGTGTWQVATASATNAWPGAAGFIAVRPK